MIQYRDFPVLIIDHELNKDTGGGRAIRSVIAHLEDMDFSVIESLNGEDGIFTYKSHAEISCVLVDWEIGENTDGPGAADIVLAIRERNDKIPIYIVTEKHKVQDIPTAALSVVQEFVWKMEDTPEFIAGKITMSSKSYLGGLMPPFFKELVKYATEYKYAWHTPGHMGGLAFRKSPAGRIFYDFFGENVFRADLSVSVPELGSLMGHAGVNGEAEAQAAKNFGAERTYFVTNGTSTANKIVMFGCVTPGDVVLVDRNCHKSLQHAITMTGAVPIYLIPSRNAYGIIGGIHLNQFDEDTIKSKIQASPLIKDKNAKIKLTVVTNSTYDGLLYNVVKLKEKLKDITENIHFDEAWYAYANFHPIYDDRYAMCKKHDEAIHPAVFATHSTHKLLASFSQGSMVHVKSGARKIDHERFNEAFMMHTSTSPQYSIIASLDVGSKMMEGSAGRAILQDAIDEAVVFRKKMVQIGSDLKKSKIDDHKKWFFTTWQADKISSSAEYGKKLKNEPFITADSAVLERSPDCWLLNPDDKWHGFKGSEENYMMLDPIKVTVLSPGINIDGTMEEWGIPAPLISKFLMSRGLVVEKTGFYSFLVLFSIGVTKGKSGSMLAEIYAFKNMYDDNAELSIVFPELAKAHPERYAGVHLQELANEMHEHLKGEDISKVTTDVFAMSLQQEMTPSEAYAALVRGNVEEVAVRDALNRIPAAMLVPYPPGIPIIMPGEKFTSDTKGIIEYLAVYEDFDNSFPGFETETHGIILKKEDGKIKYYVNCVK